MDPIWGEFILGSYSPSHSYVITYKKIETAKQLKPNTAFETNTADIHFAIVYIAKTLQIL